MIARTSKTKTRTNDAALAAFVPKKTEIDAMLTRLQTFSDEHFGVAPDEISWDQVGSLGYYAELLKRVTGSACCHGATKAPRHASPFKEGEHAG